jgi:hypothetical protein
MVAHRGEFAGDRPGQRLRQIGTGEQRVEDLARLVLLARLPQLTGVEQTHAGLIGKFRDHPGHDPLGQIVALQLLREIAEGQPGVELVGDVIDQMAEQPPGALRVAAAGVQRQQRMAPTLGAAFAQQGLESAAGGAFAVAEQGQGDFGAAHRRRGLGAGPPEFECGRGRVLVLGQQRDPGRALGDRGIAVGGAGGLQIPACSLIQTPGLQRELAGQRRRERLVLRGARRGRDAGQQRQAKAEDGGPAHRVSEWGCRHRRAEP